MNQQNELKLLVIVGPSGVGKGTLISKLMKDFPNSFCFSISHTTRKPRLGEVDGVNYYFISKEEFKKMLDEDEFIEFNLYNDNYYGTSKSELRNLQISGKVCILDIDINGARKLLNTDLGANYIAILPPSIEELRKRLLGRNTDSIEAINKRIERSTEEVEEIGKVDFFYIKILNDDLNISYPIFKNSVTELYPHLI